MILKNLIHGKFNDEECAMHLNDDLEIIINDKADKFIEELF